MSKTKDQQPPAASSIAGACKPASFRTGRRDGVDRRLQGPEELFKRKTKSGKE
jgi:hypothetical protein